MKTLVFSMIMTVGTTLGAAAQERHDCVMDPSTVIEVGSAVDGILKEAFVTRGDTVKAGDLIARLEAGVEEASLAYAVERATSGAAVDIAKNRLDLVTTEVQRTEKLAKTNLVSDSALEAAKAELDAAKLELRQAEMEQKLAGLEQSRVEAQLKQREIRSPIDAVVITRMMGPGEFVYSQAPVAQLAKIDPIHVEVFLPIELYPDVTKGAEAVVFPAQPIGGEYTAKITVIDRVFDAASDTFGVRLALENPGGKLPAGLDCEVSF